MLMTAVLRMYIVGVLAILAHPTWAQTKPKFEPFEFPTGDKLAVYTMLDLKKVGNNQVETFVQQKTRSGLLAFTRRLIDCKSMRFKTLASSDSMEGLKRSKP